MVFFSNRNRDLWWLLEDFQLSYHKSQLEGIILHRIKSRCRRLSVCAFVRCMCVCERERERERDECVCERERQREECVCVWEREREMWAIFQRNIILHYHIQLVLVCNGCWISREVNEREEEIGLMLLATIEIKCRGSSKRTKIWLHFCGIVFQRYALIHRTEETNLSPEFSGSQLDIRKKINGTLIFHSKKS